MDPANISETDWVEYFDDNTQQPYYINKLTRHSQYECPQEYEDWKQNEIEKYLKTTNWRRRKDEKRKAYFYFNKLTNSTQWEIPSEEEEFVEFLKNVNIDRTDWGSGSEDDENDVEDRKEKRRDSSGRGYDQEEGDELEFHQDYYSDEEEHNDVSITRNFDDSFVEDGELLEEDSKLKELEFLESKLSAKDSIMEPTINQTIHKYLRVAPDATPGDIVTKLSTNYVGYAQLTHIICHWITLIQRNFDEEAFIAKEMGLLIKRKFNKDIADRLIDEHSGVPTWLHDMMHDQTWRRLLIELFDESSNKGSVLLGYCLRYLSSQGFHREIAHVIREADYFQVFNDLLIDSISRIGKELCGKNKQTHTSQSGEDDYSFTGLLKDLKRMCCSSEYMFFYAQELVTATGKALNKKRKVCDVGEEGEETDNKADSAVLLNGQGIDMHYQWSKKMRRLCQELNETAVWPDSAETMPQPLSRSKSFTLKLTELYSSQLVADELSLDREVWGLRLHQIFKIIPAVLDDDDDIPEPKIGELCEILFGIDRTIPDSEFLVRDSSEDFPIRRFLANANETHLEYLFELILCPRFINILARCLIHPVRSVRRVYSARRVSSLLSLISSLYQAATLHREDVNWNLFPLIQTLVSDAEMCLEMSGLGVSLNLTTSHKFQAFLDTLNEPLVSMVCLYWVRCNVADIQFLRGSRQSAIYPVVLQIIVQAINNFPLQRQECLEILKICYYTACVGLVDSGENKQVPRISFSSISPSCLVLLLQEISKDIIDIIVHLLGRGFISSPMEFLLAHFHVDSLHRFDTALIRHVFMKLFSVISPPYSSFFIQSVVDLVLHPSSRKALESQHFSPEAVLSLRKFSESIHIDDLDPKKLEEFQRLVTLCGRSGATSSFLRR